MGKTLVRNHVGEKTFTLYLPCSDTEASAFAGDILDGSSEIYGMDSSSGNELAPNVIEYVVTGQTKADKRKTTISFYALPSKTEADIVTALTNKTFNGVKFEEIFIISAKVVLSA